MIWGEKPLFLETPKYHQSPPDSWRLGAHPVSLAVLQPRVLVSCQLLLKLLDLKLRLTNICFLKNQEEITTLGLHVTFCRFKFCICIYIYTYMWYDYDMFTVWISCLCGVWFPTNVSIPKNSKETKGWLKREFMGRCPIQLHPIATRPPNLVRNPRYFKICWCTNLAFFRCNWFHRFSTISLSKSGWEASSCSWHVSSISAKMSIHWLFIPHECFSTWHTMHFSSCQIPRLKHLDKW